MALLEMPNHNVFYISIMFGTMLKRCLIWVHGPSAIFDYGAMFSVAALPWAVL